MTRRNKGKQRAAVLELRWHQPLLPTARRGETEIAYLRFDKDHYRVTIQPVEQQTYAPSPLASTPLPALVRGWSVAMNGELLAGEPLSFTDACYAGWAVFVESVPPLARFLTQGVAWSAARLEGYDPSVLEVETVYGNHADPGADQGRSQEVGPDPAAVQPVPRSGDEAGRATV